MTNSIPASVLANVIPGVLSAGGNPLSLNAIFLTSDPSIPVGTVQPFASALDVSAWFGAGSPEAALGNVYFGGYANATALPSVLYFAQFNGTAVAAYVRGANVAGLTLTQIQALSGLVTVSIDGRSQISAAINLSAATSPSNAATLITAGMQNAGGRFVGTAVQTASADLLNVTAVTSGSLHIGDVITGAGVDAGLTISSLGSGTGGIGTYHVSTTTGFSSTTIDVAGVGVCSYDALRSAFEITSPTTGATSALGYPAASALTTGLSITQATGAVISLGAAIAVPATLMNSIVGITQNWASFLTVAEQILSVKQAFAAWVQTTNKRYAYVGQDSDPTILTANASGTFGALVNAANDDGIIPVYDNSGTGVMAALQCAIAASVNYATRNGRTTFAFRGQAGLTAQVTNQTQYENILGNGYNCYAAFATANAQFTQNQPGQISGEFKWCDTYFNQIFLNASFQLALMNLLSTIPSVPYVTRGYNLIRQCLLTPINAALNFGSIVAGVILSGSQSAALNSATGDGGATATIQNTGWYLQILDPGSIVRGNRGTPVINFWYTDGGSVQQITMSSVDVL